MSSQLSISQKIPSLIDPSNLNLETVVHLKVHTVLGKKIVAMQSNREREREMVQEGREVRKRGRMIEGKTKPE